MNRMNRFLPSRYATRPSENRSNFAAELCLHRNKTVAVPGFSCPHPITRPFDTDFDSDPDPEHASPWTFSDGPS
ncbi:MAG: hypothetical protein PHF14_14325 [Verrucomicrobiota bacterium]|nr:hypothetical protein [Verrucomicrobiota bacterium]